MGRRWNKKKKQNAKNDNKVEKPKKDRADPQGYIVVKKESKDFETFYKSQNIVPEEEWTEFMTCLRTSLPAAFRITGNTTRAKALLKILKEDFFEPLEKLSPDDFTPTVSAAAKLAAAQQNGSRQWPVEDEPIKPLELKCLTWYPKGLAYQLNLSRRDIRRCEAYWSLHQCLITETDAGSISRQEAVSMIPPLLLNVLPHHNVLDMCAAPGSKTAQIIEQMHSSSDPVLGAIPPGVVVANDADNKRCYLLTHQAKRLQSPSIIITNHDACFMPNMFYTKPDGSSGKLKYDRILCDVPCSGDGTLRKNCDVWGKWNPVNGCNLHGLQLRIARRGLELLSVGGRMVYSTCSLSPMENEAVLQRLLLEAAGSVSIVDCSSALPGLKFCRGLTKWTVVTRDMQVLPTPQDIPLKLSNVYHKHLFPVDEDLHLDRCMRLLPHHQDTGGFFVAVLEKTAPLPGEKVEGPVAATKDGAAAAAQPSDTAAKNRNTQRSKQKNNKRRQGFKEEPYYYLSDVIADWEKDYKAGKEMTPTAPPPNGYTAEETTDAAATTETTGATRETAAADATRETAAADATIETAAADATIETAAADATIETAAADATIETAGAASEGKPGKPLEDSVATAISTKDDKSAEISVESANESNAMEVDSSLKTADVSGSTTEVVLPDTAPALTTGSTISNKIDHDKEDLRIWSTVSTFFGLNKELPQASYANFMTRSREGKKRNLYFTNALVRDLIDRNQDRMKIINTGVKVLVRTDNKGAACDFRLAQEGIHSIVPLITKRRLPVTRADLLLVLNNEDTDAPPELAGLSQECKDLAHEMVTGSVLLEYRGDPTVPDDEQDSVPEDSKIKIELVGWKGKASLRCYVVRSDRVHYLRLLRADTSKYVKNKFSPAAVAVADVAVDATTETADATADAAVDENDAAATHQAAFTAIASADDEKASVVRESNATNGQENTDEVAKPAKKAKMDVDQMEQNGNGAVEMDTN